MLFLKLETNLKLNLIVLISKIKYQYDFKFCRLFFKTNDTIAKRSSGKVFSMGN